MKVATGKDIVRLSLPVTCALHRNCLLVNWILNCVCMCVCVPERELPAGLDQRLITWETVQKENYLAKLERQHWESSEERLKSTSSK